MQGERAGVYFFLCVIVAAVTASMIAVAYLIDYHAGKVLPQQVESNSTKQKVPKMEDKKYYKKPMPFLPLEQTKGKIIKLTGLRTRHYRLNRSSHLRKS